MQNGMSRGSRNPPAGHVRRRWRVFAAGSAVLAAGVAAMPSAARAQMSFTGISMTRVNSSDFAIGGGNISSGTGQWTVFLAPGSYNATPAYYNPTPGPLSVTLTNGTYNFFATAAFGSSYGATNMWFDGAATPGISVFSGSSSSLGSAAPYYAEGASGQELYNSSTGAQTVTGSNSLTYTDAIGTVTLTAYQLDQPSLVTAAGVPTINAQSSTGSQQPTGIEFTLVVSGVQDTSVPEPASMALLGAGLAGLGAARRRKA
jgi:hypothetical protein